MSKSLKNYTTIRSVLSQKEWSARSLRICFLLMPWQDGIEVTEELMKAVVGWEGKLNNFFLKSLDLWKNSSPKTTAMKELGVADQQLLSALNKAEADVDIALCDSFNTSAVMRILSDLVTESNSATALSNQIVILFARWVTRIVTIFGLDPEGDLSNPDRIGWSGLDIPAPAKSYIYPASRLRDKIRTLVCSGSVDHTVIAKLADEVTIPASTPVVESSKPYDQVLQQFRTDVKVLAAQQAPAKDLLALCDQLRDVHLWNLGIYLEDRNNSQPALVRPLDKLLIEARAERQLAGIAKAKAKLAMEAREAEREKVDPLLMFKTSDEYLEWVESSTPTVPVSNNRRKKLVKGWERQKKRHALDIYKCLVLSPARIPSLIPHSLTLYMSFLGTVRAAFLFRILAPVTTTRTPTVSKGTISAIASDSGHLSPQYGIVVNVLMLSGTSRMGDLSKVPRSLLVPTSRRTKLLF
ncbi:hypothetical protein LTR28_009708 [Elasticomyces elasticus]|nr:hypothetical protein LTR28_009708 [Elasticomyces elasticus]